MTPIGVLVMAYGTADGPDDIERYYTDIRGGRAPSPEHLEELRGRYAAIGNRFPLLAITRLVVYVATCAATLRLRHPAFAASVKPATFIVLGRNQSLLGCLQIVDPRAELFGESDVAEH